MLQSTVVLFVAALIAGALGFPRSEAVLSDIASVMLFVFVVVFVTRDLLERTRNGQARRGGRGGRGGRGTAPGARQR